MVFNSASFLLFFPLVYVTYRFLGEHYALQNRWLLLASYLFYGWWDWRFPALMGLTTLIDYGVTRRMRSHPAQREILLVVSLLNNLGVLFLLKYYEFFQANILALLSQFGIESSQLLVDVLLPVGISFYTFQRMTFVFDVYRDRAYSDIHFLDFALFVSFFPLLLSGPIERARRLMPQLCQKRDITGRHFEEGTWLFMWGLFKKVYVADNMAAFVDPVFSDGWHGTGGEALLAIYGYAFQIYCDFSGYTDMARGIAKLLGFEIMLNFNLPYFATNPSDFWRRWHISLSSWLRDYVYIPLGGSRHGMWTTMRNLMITMILVGIWHGAAWTFVFWGTYQGFLLVAHRMLSADRGVERQASKLGIVASMIFMFHLTCFGWTMFRATSLQQTLDLWHAVVFTLVPGGLPLTLSTQFLGYIGLLLVVQLIQFAKKDLFVIDRVPVGLKGVVYGTLFYLTVLHGGTSNSFIYFQF